MSERYKVKDTDGIYFITITIIDWIDLLIRPAYKHIIIDSLMYCQHNKGLIIYAYVIMSSHLHLIAGTSKEVKLPDIIRDFKRYTSLKLIEALNEYPESRREWLLEKFSEAAGKINRVHKYKIWQNGFHPVELSDNIMIRQRLDYIHNNPVEEEIVCNPAEYRYSSAINYESGSGEINVEFIV